MHILPQIPNFCSVLFLKYDYLSINITQRTIYLSFLVYRYVYNYTDSMKTLGETLKKLRKSRSLRQADLAHELNLSRSQINNYENGFSEPDLTTLFRLASFFNVSLDALTGRTDATDDERLHNTLVGVQKTYGALSESQRENFCKQLDHYVRFLGEHNEIL